MIIDIWWHYFLLAVGGVIYVTMMYIVLRQPITDLQPKATDEDQQTEAENQKVVVE
jgi:hypothetical protein